MISGIRTVIVAFVAMLSVGSTAMADSGTVRISFVKAGWVIGGAVGSGTMTFKGRTYPLSVGGLSYGLTFGGSQTELHGRVQTVADVQSARKARQARHEVVVDAALDEQPGARGADLAAVAVHRHGRAGDRDVEAPELPWPPYVSFRASITPPSLPGHVKG